MATPLLCGLPDEIVIWEILVHLTPKDLLRCRPVCRSWRRATSTRRFLLAHHDRQPTLPLLYDRNITEDGARSLGIIAFDHRAGLAATDRLQSVARLGSGSIRLLLKACCDGLLVLFINDTRFSICNPATRQYAPLKLHRDFMVVGMYMHPPTGEYRLLLNLDTTVMFDELSPGAEYGIHVFTIGSSQPPRHIGYMEKLVYATVSLMFRGRLHWYLGDMIMVFDTIAESFSQMGSPVVPRCADLFEIGGMLGMFSLNDEATVVDIWVMQDYKSEVWAINHRVELPVAEIRLQHEMFDNPCDVKAVSSDGGVLVLVRFGDWLHQVDINGKLVASLHRRDHGLTNLWLKQTLVSHTLFPTLEGYVVNALPFI